jgi:hypothetical protein
MDAKPVLNKEQVEKRFIEMINDYLKMDLSAG